MQLDHIRGEIERMRLQVHRQRGDIRKLQQAGISTASAEALLERMLERIDKLCAERDRLKKEQGASKGQSLGRSSMVTEPSQMVRRECGQPAMGEGLG
jgi:hypothetical protein